MFSFKDLKEKKEIQKAKKEQKQNLEFILTDDSYMAQYLADKKKKAANRVYNFDLLDEADLKLLDERVKEYKKEKKIEVAADLKEKAEKEEALEKVVKKKREAEEKLNKEKRYAEAHNLIYCDYATMERVINNKSDVCPVCGSRFIREDKYEATVTALFPRLVGYRTGYVEARAQYVYETAEKTFPAKACRCPKCEYTVMSMSYEYAERHVIGQIDMTDTDSEEYRKYKKREYVDKYVYTIKTKNLKGFKAGRLYSDDIYELADLALNKFLKEEYREYMNNEVFHEKKIEKPTVSANSFSAADEISKFYDLKVKGIISEEEFEAKKKELLSR